MDGFLVIGGTLAGAQAAWDLAEAGARVHLVSENPWFAAPEGDLDVRAWLLQTSRHPNIRFLAPASVAGLSKEGAAYKALVRVRSRFVDVERCTGCGECEQVCPVVVDITRHAIWRPANAVPDVYAIERSGRPPCSDTCPGGIHVQGYVALIAQRRFEEALELIREAIPLPAICGRVCDHPCEANCRRNEVDRAVSTRALKRFVADYELRAERRPSLLGRKGRVADVGQGRKVAVIGSGPAGLTVAAELALMGYQVTVFEALPVAGGMLAVGIPPYRLPKDILRLEIEAVEALGVEIRLNSPVRLGDGGLDGLFAQGYEAIFIGVGAHRSTELGIPGEHLEGVVHGARLLKMLNLSQQVDDPQWKQALARVLVRGADTRVAVIGGGNTAMDVSRSLRRLGVKDVTVLYRRSREEMPAIPEEVEEAEREGIPFQFLVAPVRVVERDGRVAGLDCVRMRLGEPDASGRPRPVPIPGSEFRLDVDVVVPAIGQSPDLSFLGAGHGLAITPQGTFHVDRRTYMTNRPGIFAAGDAITQPVSVIHAIASAKRAAAAMDAYLRGVPLADERADVPVARRELAEAQRQVRPRVPVPTIPMDERLSTFKEVELGFDEEQAVAEASRCLACGPCSECLACVRVCEPGAIRHDWVEEERTLTVAGVIVAEERPGLDVAPSRRTLHVAADDRIGASAAAARLLALAAGRPRQTVAAWRRRAAAASPRIGVWVCACQGQISERLPLDVIVQRAAALQDVVWAEVVEQACAPDAGARLAEAVARHDLNRVVVAACSCCALDQVCYSCTTQRLRCKGQLLPLNEAGTWLEFVNIREQCAWLYEGDEANVVAESLMALGVARARAGGADMPFAEYPVMPAALVVGQGRAAPEMARLLSRVGITTSWARPAGGERHEDAPNGVQVLPAASLERVEGAMGDFRVTLRGERGEMSATCGAVVLVGQEPDRRVPGLYTVHPAASKQALEAMAAKISALLGRNVIRRDGSGATVREALCRACGTCAEVCPFGAVEVRETGGRRAAVVDAGRCQGCGLCVARCPSGAMVQGAYSDRDVSLALELLCRGWK